MALKNLLPTLAVKREQIVEQEEFVAKFTCRKQCCDSPSPRPRTVLGFFPLSTEGGENTREGLLPDLLRLENLEARAGPAAGPEARESSKKRRWLLWVACAPEGVRAKGTGAFLRPQRPSQ